MSANIWNVGQVPIKDAMNSIDYQLFNPVAGTEVLVLTDFQYVVGVNAVQVYKNGSILTPEVDYQELSSTQIQLTQDTQAGEKYLVIGFIKIADISEQVEELYSDIARYQLGVSASDPVEDLLGRPLVAGAQYYNLTTGTRIFNGTTWVPAAVVLSDVVTSSQLTSAINTTLLKSNNLSDLLNPATARTNLGLGNAATQNMGTSPGDVVTVQTGSKLPVLDASNLTNVPKSVRDVLQEQFTILNTVVTGTATIPFDDTIPQISEGFQIISVPFTPLESTSLLAIEFLVHAGVSTTASTVIAALFRDAEVNALVTSINVINNNWQGQIVGRVMVNANNILLRTFTLRVGAAAANTVTVNGHLGNRYFGGSLLSWVKVTEYKM